MHYSGISLSSDRESVSVRCSVSFSPFFELYQFYRYDVVSVDMIFQPFQQKMLGCIDLKCNVQEELSSSAVGTVISLY